MNHSIYGADRQTHLKIVVIGLLCACFVLIVGRLRMSDISISAPRRWLRPAAPT